MKPISEIKELYERFEQGIDFFSRYAEEIKDEPLLVGFNFWGDVVYVRRKNEQEKWETTLGRVKMVFDWEGIDHGLLFTTRGIDDSKALEITYFSHHGAWTESFKIDALQRGSVVCDMIEITNLMSDHALTRVLKYEHDGRHCGNEDQWKEILDKKAERAYAFRSGEWLEEPLYIV